MQIPLLTALFIFTPLVGVSLLLDSKEAISPTTSQYLHLVCWAIPAHISTCVIASGMVRAVGWVVFRDGKIFLSNHVSLVNTVHWLLTVIVILPIRYMLSLSDDSILTRIHACAFVVCSIRVFVTMSATILCLRVYNRAYHSKIASILDRDRIIQVVLDLARPSNSRWAVTIPHASPSRPSHLVHVLPMLHESRFPILNTHQISELATAAFTILTHNNREPLTRSLLAQVFPDPDAALTVFDRNGDGVILRDEFVDVVTAAVKARHHTAASLQDTRSMFGTLEMVVGFCLHVGAIPLHFWVWGVNVLEGFSVFSTIVLSFAFVFGETLKLAFENSVYLFGENRYDVGDNIMYQGEWVLVKKITLMHTVLEKDTGMLFSIPTMEMRGATVTNINTMHRWVDKLVIRINFGKVSLNLLDIVRHEIVRVIETKSLKIRKDSVFVIYDAVDSNNVVMHIKWRYKTPLNIGANEAARSCIISQLHTFLYLNGIKSDTPLLISSETPKMTDLI